MIETTENGDSFDWRIPVIPVDPVNTDSVCVWDYDSPFGLMIAYLMKSSERDVFKYWKGGGENSITSGKFELDTVEGFA